MITTLNQLKSEVTQIANAHLMVHSFYWGSPEIIAKRTDVVYPLVFAYPISFRLNSNTTDRVIRIGVIDRIFKSWDNLDDVHSDCELIARDFYRVLNKSPRLRKRWRIDNSPNGEVFTLHDKGQGDNADYVAGVYFDVDISLRDKSGVCDIPLDGNFPLR